jgi:hypothetical protein
MPSLKIVFGFFVFGLVFGFFVVNLVKQSDIRSNLSSYEEFSSYN